MKTRTNTRERRRQYLAKSNSGRSSEGERTVPITPWENIQRVSLERAHVSGFDIFVVNIRRESSCPKAVVPRAVEVRGCASVVGRVVVVVVVVCWLHNVPATH